MVPERVSELRQWNVIASVPDAEEPTPVPVVVQAAVAAARLNSTSGAFVIVSAPR